MSEFFVHFLETAIIGSLFGVSCGVLVNRFLKSSESPPLAPDFPPSGWMMEVEEDERSGFESGQVLAGDTDEAKVQKLAADVTDGVRDRAREAIVKSGTARYNKKSSEVSFGFKLLLNDREVCYKRTFTGECWEIVKLSYNEVFWYHTLLNYLVEEAVEALTYTLERSADSSTSDD